MDDQAGILVEGRRVPFPKSVSPEGRAFLASMVGPDGVPFSAIESPAPTDIQGWRKAKESAAVYMLQLFSRWATGLTSGIETITLGGAVVHLATPTGGAPSDRAYLEIHREPDDPAGAQDNAVLLAAAHNEAAQLAILLE